MQRHSQRILLLLALLIALPFLNQPFHIDDPNFLALARHASPNPLDLYDFYINWGGTEEWAFDILANPPLVPWYLAAISSVANGLEWVFHLAFLPFLLLALHGLWRLGRRFSESADLTLLFGVVAPALVVSSHTVMPDLPLMAFYFNGVALALEGLDENRNVKAIIGGLLAGLSSLCRYSGMTAIPLLLLYILLNRSRSRNALLVAISSVTPLLIWSLVSLEHYGRIHWLTIAAFETQTTGHGALLHKLGYQVAALGLVVALAPLLALVLTGLPSRAARIGAALGGGAALGLWIYERQPARTGLLLIAGFAGGAILLALLLEACGGVTKKRVWRRRGGGDADRLFLAAWLGGMLVFNLGLLFASVRYLLPALPPAILLVQRGMGMPVRSQSSGEGRRRGLPLRGTDGHGGWTGDWDGDGDGGGHGVWDGAGTGRGGPAGEGRRGGLPMRGKMVTVSVLLSFALSMGLSRADYRMARAYRDFVEELPPTSGQRFFVGHWGMQYYLEQRRAQALSSEANRLPNSFDVKEARALSSEAKALPEAGDEIIRPRYAWPQDFPDGLKVKKKEVVQSPARSGLRTFTVDGRGCFYSDMLSPGPTAVWLPFGFSGAPLETFERWEVLP